jgi:hypothetical protein
MPPTDPKRLQVADRFETVINAITAGDNYFFTPHKVAKKLLEYGDAKYGPLYMILDDSGGEIVFSGHELFDETFYISVHGIVHDRDDLVTAVEKAVRDVRRAVNEDSKSTASGSLMNITEQVRIDEPPELDYFEDFAFFRQRFRNQISGDFGEL